MQRSFATKYRLPILMIDFFCLFTDTAWSTVFILNNSANTESVWFPYWKSHKLYSGLSKHHYTGDNVCSSGGNKIPFLRHASRSSLQNFIIVWKLINYENFWAFGISRGLSFCLAHSKWVLLLFFLWQSRMLLQPELVLEDVSQDHARKTVSNMF